MTFAPVAVGETISDKYLVERIIGEGGMGVVIAARHLELDQTVAIKFLLPEIAKLDMAAERFRREAWAAARIRGEHVCRVLDVGTLPNGVPYMVMEYLDGCDLATELNDRKTLPAEEAVDYVLQTCEALAEAHAAGVIHRDLKPANLFLARRADNTRGIKVLDFGVSKVLSETGRAAGLSLTSTKTLVGSPLYMSPEQLDSAKGVDARTDIWALGVVLYELITGRTPFNGDSIAQLVSGVLHADPPWFSDVGVTDAGDLETVVRRAVNKRREDRHATVAELAADLVPFGPHTAGHSALRTARMLAREGATSLPVSLPSGERPITPRGSLQPNRTPSDRVNLAKEQERTPGQRGSGARESTPVSWEKERSATRRKRIGLAVLALLGAGVAALIALPRGGSRDVPPGASDDDGSPAGGRRTATSATTSTTSPARPAQTPGEAAAQAPAAGSKLGDVPVAAADRLGGLGGVDAGLPPEPPMQPPQPEPAARMADDSAARARDAARRSARHGAERATSAPRPAANGVSDFGGRR